MKRWFGVIAVTAIVGVAAALAGFNVWWHYNQSRQIHALWGTDALMRIGHGDAGEIVALAPPSDLPLASGTKVVSIGGKDFPQRGAVDLATARGASNLRYALGQDASYDWIREPSAAGRWSLAIRFVDDRGQTLLAFDLDQGIALENGSGKAVLLTEKMASGLKKFADEALSPPSPGK